MEASAAVADNLFGGLSLELDRMAEHRDDAAWISARQAENPRYLLLDPKGRAYLNRSDDRLRWLNAAERSCRFAAAPTVLLGQTGDGQTYFLLSSDDEAQAAALDEALGARRLGLREAGLLLPAFEAALFAYAKGLLHWQRETRHCSYCGAPLRLAASGHRLHCTSKECGREHFPRTDVAVIVIVDYQGACLLGRQRNWPAGRYSTLAGFVEPGEALEDAVRREVAEESGVKVGPVHYHSSQPWPMPASLMAGFSASALSPEIRLRDDELEDARWFTPEQLISGVTSGAINLPSPLSISYRLIADWLRRRAEVSLDELRVDTAC